MRKFINSHTYIIASALITLSLLVSVCSNSKTPADTIVGPKAISADAININTATADELARIPQIGEHFASKIVAYRKIYGSFRKPEHLMLVEGISEKKFRAIKEFIRTE